jgi:chitin disaccharide deacetylase
MTRRFLIVNADDFGLSPGVNTGIIQAHERGIVTSASLMTRWPAAVAAAEYARVHPRLGVGLHVDLGEWIYRDGEWQLLYQVVDPTDAAAVHAEVRRQLDMFPHLLGRDPDHIDSHQHVHREGAAYAACREIADCLRVPLRHFSHVKYCGNFYGQGNAGEPYPGLIGVAALCDLLRDLPAGATELCCHPAAGADLETMYLHERHIELATLCDPAVRDALDRADIALCTFATLGASATA